MLIIRINTFFVLQDYQESAQITKNQRRFLFVCLLFTEQELWIKNYIYLQTRDMKLTRTTNIQDT